MITHILALAVGLVAGILISRKHRSKLESAEQKGRSLLDVLKGR